MATDPRPLKGSIAGPGGPRDRHGVVLDARHAVLLDNVEVCAVETTSGAQHDDAIALQLSGRINRTRDRVDVLFLFDVDGAAAIVTELLALADRMDADDLAATVRARLDRLAQADALGKHHYG